MLNISERLERGSFVGVLATAPWATNPCRR